MQTTHSLALFAALAAGIAACSCPGFRGAASRSTDPSLTPIADGVRFSHRVSNPYFPLSTVRNTELRSPQERVVRAVALDTKVVGGVECLVLAEQEYKGETLAEISYNYFAQDSEGNVYYFGEDVDEYENGKVVSHGGAWQVGRNAKEPCLYMPARLRKGFRFKSENSPPDAEEWNEIEATDAEITTAAGTFRNVVVIAESNRPDRWQERKYYSSGLGLVSENLSLGLAAMPESR